MEYSEMKAIQARIKLLEEKIFNEEMADFANLDWIRSAKAEVKELKTKLLEG